MYLRQGSAGAEVTRLATLLRHGCAQGAFNHQLDQAVRVFQANHGLGVDGIVGPATWRALYAQQPTPAEGRALRWGAVVAPEFRAEVVNVARRLKLDADHLMACMAFETGYSFRPDVRNQAGSGATGLIQFMPSTARGLGTTTDALARLSAVQQLAYVEAYFKNWVGRLLTLPDLYMAILWPKAVGQPDHSTLFATGALYRQNAGLDVNRDHRVTKHEAAYYVRRAYDDGARAMG